MAGNIKCVIVDDEPKAIELLSESIGYLFEEVEIVSVHTTWTTALHALKNYPCDLLFLDISMPGKTGFDLLKLLPDLSSEVIFVTAHSDFALNAFKVNASGYLLKPVDDTELVNAIDGALKRIKVKKIAAENSTNKFSLLNKKIGIPNNTGIDYVNIEDIIYVESLNRTTNVVLANLEIGSSYNIGKFKTMLEASSFFQVHRSYIVNLNCIKRYDTSGNIITTNNKEIPVAKSVRETFLSIFNSVSNKPT